MITDKEHEEAIASRDYWEEKATELADDIAKYLEFEVGEHSLINDPVNNAIDWVYKLQCDKDDAA
jgi:hypothetical protein